MVMLVTPQRVGKLWFVQHPLRACRVSLFIEPVLTSFSSLALLTKAPAILPNPFPARSFPMLPILLQSFKPSPTPSLLSHAFTPSCPSFPSPEPPLIPASAHTFSLTPSFHLPALPLPPSFLPPSCPTSFPDFLPRRHSQRLPPWRPFTASQEPCPLLLLTPECFLFPPHPFLHFPFPPYPFPPFLPPRCSAK